MQRLITPSEVIYQPEPSEQALHHPEIVKAVNELIAENYTRVSGESLVTQSKLLARLAGKTGFKTTDDLINSGSLNIVSDYSKVGWLVTVHLDFTTKRDKLAYVSFKPIVDSQIQ
jgi:hypothetical protein